MDTANIDLQAALDRVIAGRDGLCVLEAGCGSTSRVRLPAGARLVGIDISANQLARNTVLHERVLGDVQSYRWPRAEFDMIVSWDVLEHLPRPLDAMDRLVAALRPGGIVVLALPNLYSIKGLVTRLTPYRVHEWFYRYVIGDKRAQHEFDQFPTYLRAAIAPFRLARYARDNGLEIAYFNLYEGPVQCYLRKHNRLADRFFAAVGALSHAVTRGRYDLNWTDCMLVLRKGAGAAEEPAMQASAPKAQHAGA